MFLLEGHDSSRVVLPICNTPVAKVLDNFITRTFPLLLLMENFSKVDCEEPERALSTFASYALKHLNAEIFENSLATRMPSQELKRGKEAPDVSPPTGLLCL